MATFDAQAVAQLLREFAGRSSLRGGNPYRAKAYARAADSLSALVVPLAQIVEAGRLTEIPGIGDAIADIVTKLHRTGFQALRPCARKFREVSWKCSPCLACGLTRCSSFIRPSASPPSPIWNRPRARIASRARRDLEALCRQRFSEASKLRAAAKAVFTCTARQFCSKAQYEACNRCIRS